MEDMAAATVRAVLGALADLAPSGDQQGPALAIPTDWFGWLPVESVGVFATLDRQRQLRQGLPPTREEGGPRVVSVNRWFGERLAAVDQLRLGERSLRLGWLFLAGKTTLPNGKVRRVFHPLVTLPVRVDRAPLGNASLIPAGDVEISELVTDHAVRHDLESRMEFGGGALVGQNGTEVPPALLVRLDRLHQFAREVAAAAGLPATRMVAATGAPERLMQAGELVVVAGVAVYAVHPTGETNRASSLRAWAGGPVDRWTAFHSLYTDLPSPPPPAPSTAGVPGGDPGSAIDAEAAGLASPFVLTPAQRGAVARSRRQPITLISGAPGTGKSHTIAAIACDAVANGERVLVAAKTDATVDALVDLLQRAPGPEPVVFGSNDRREALAERLSAGQLHPALPNDLEAARTRWAETDSARRGVRSRVAGLLRAELLAAGHDADIGAARLGAPGFFDPGTEGAEIDRLFRTAEVPRSGGQGWLARRRRRNALRRLLRMAQAAPSTTEAALRAAWDLAGTSRSVLDVQAAGGLQIGALWDTLSAAEDGTRAAWGAWLAEESRSARRLDRAGLGAVAAVATALRSGRSARREQLRRLDDDHLTRALPLWVGTLADIDDLLPPVAGLFDLVVLDEASSIDQPLAATALLRGRRAVITGDPRQLRHVSFVSDAQMRTVAGVHGLDATPVLAARLDVRRNSAFDVAAGVAPVLVLDEHFRSNPHLVDFVARRFYDGKVTVATRAPSTQSLDCVDVVRTGGPRDKAGVVTGEVDCVVRLLRSLRRSGASSVGVVTPFRAQADAIEAAALGAFTADDLEALDLRVGTVHAFQGNERDTIIASLGVGSGGGARSWQFVEDPRLFAVLVTRARRQMTIVTAEDPPAGGLVADYLAQADAPPGPPPPAGPVGPWAASIATDLAAAGAPVITAYPTGRHTLDICLDARRDVALVCGVHPEGADAHIEAQLSLLRRGWTLLEAFPSRWAERRGELVVEVLAALADPAPSRTSGDERALTRLLPGVGPEPVEDGPGTVDQ